MSDSVRAQKLAAARKKLKEFQQKAKHIKKENVEDDFAAKGIQHDEEQNMTASTHSSLSRQSVEEERAEEVANADRQEFGSGSEQDIETEQAAEQQSLAEENNSERDSKYSGTYEPPSTETSDLPIYNYFSNEGYDSAYNQRNNFFDAIVDNQFQTNGNENTEDNNDIFNSAVYLDSKLYSNHSMFKTEDVNEMYDNVHKSSVTYNDAKEINNYLEKRDSAEESAQLEARESDNYYEEKDEREDSELLEEISHLQLSEPASSGQQSNLESLMQLSSQMAQLVDCKAEVDPSETAVLKLERRNQELASLLEEERVKSQQLVAQLNIKEEQILHLESAKAEQDTKVKCELGQLQEQLQNHIQTIGILVGEKTELSAMLSQAQTSSKQKTMELEELQEKLKSSNYKISALASELNSLKSETTKYGEVAAEQSEAFYKLKAEYENLKLKRDELSQDLLEVHEKLSASSVENIRLQKQLQEVNSQLSLANIRIQQLTMGDTAQLDAQMESVMQQKLVLDKKVTELSNTLETVTKERDQANTQYQQYVLQLNNQLSNLANKLETVTKENEALVTREQNLVRHIGELEKHLQNVQSNQVVFTQKGDAGLEKELQEALQNLGTLKIEKEQLGENFTRICNERDMLLKDLSSKKDCISELESLVERLRVAQPDTTKLLAELESDKVAAARAISQNADLKKKLQDMEDDFIKMSNDKLELTEQLTAEQNLNKEITHRLQQCEIQLQTLADAIAIKDRELTEIRENSNDLNKEVLQLHQLADRVRHYEAQNNSVQAIQDELADAKQEITLLSSENVALKEALRHKSEDKKEENVHQKNSNPENVELEQKPEFEKTCEHSVDAIDKESAMKHLEQKFLKTMQDIANLTEEKQRLEHLVLQLQSETETIGEYIALYQHQRGILKQRAIESDEQLKQLAHDREVIKRKLEQLNNLVKKLVLEKGSLPAEILEDHEKMDKLRHEFCEDHAKIHQEIGKIRNESIAMGANCVTDENKGDEKQGRETAEKIIELLSEIKTSSLVQPAEKFHPCPLCSGKLITV